MDALNNISNIAGARSLKKLSEPEVEQLWRKYFKDKSDRDVREKLIIQYINLTKYVVSRIRVNLPTSIATEDIAGYATEGLIDAIERYSPDKGTRFETYALMRIRGTIIDKIRSQDWVPRTTRKRFKDIQKTTLELQQALGRQPSVDEIAQKMDLPKEKIQNTIIEMENSNFVSIHEKRGGETSSEGVEILDTIVDSNAKDPMAQMEEKDVKKELSVALSRLPERERMILALYYHENLTLKEIGTTLQISESRVCQLHAQAIMKLKNLLSTNNLRMRKSIV